MRAAETRPLHPDRAADCGPRSAALRPGARALPPAGDSAAPGCAVSGRVGPAGRPPPELLAPWSRRDASAMVDGGAGDRPRGAADLPGRRRSTHHRFLPRSAPNLVWRSFAVASRAANSASSGARRRDLEPQYPVRRRLPLSRAVPRSPGSQPRRRRRRPLSRHLLSSKRGRGQGRGVAGVAGGAAVRAPRRQRAPPPLPRRAAGQRRVHPRPPRSRRLARPHPRRRCGRQSRAAAGVAAVACGAVRRPAPHRPAPYRWSGRARPPRSLPARRPYLVRFRPAPLLAVPG